jgi:signal transduction histidine kinase
MVKKLFFFFCFFICVLRISANNVIVYKSPSSLIKVGSFFEILDNTKNDYDSSSVLQAKGFHTSKDQIPVFSVPDVNIWLRFSIFNQTKYNELFFYLEHFNVSTIKLYKEVNNRLISLYVDGNAFAHPPNNTLPSYLANMQLQPDSSATYYIHIESFHPLILNTYIGSYVKVTAQSEKQLFTVAVYFGILMVIFLYNLFLFFVTADRNYLLYIVYIFALGFAQFTLAGYTFKYFWLSEPAINYFAVPVTSAIAAIFGVLFSLQFLRTKYYTPFLHKLLLVTILLNIISIIASLVHLNAISYNIIVSNTIAIGALIITAAIIIISKGYRPAVYYAISWILFLTGLIIFSLRNFNVLPANSFTNYILYAGSALESVLLSIALADKINILKKEKEESQAEALQQARENEQLVNEQNIMLEKKVALRTTELQTTNVQLNEALNNLKDTQTQLVEAEKMASLGQLTAGIAHEINNPINFVKSNINPLRLDVKDLMEILNAYGELHALNDHNSYKEKLSAIEELKEDMDITYVQKEIDNLIMGIEDGAERTAEIVRGLRTFSRIDEAALKTVNVHDGILSTIVLIKNNIPYYINLVKEFNAAGRVECFPGKLNQVFMNVLTNAIQAIKSKQVKTDEETISIKTRDVENDQIEISIKDSGVGMTEEVKHRIFEPFFTTKDVGEGTGLGMAIVFKIIQKHAGKITIISAPNEGAEFIITLPHRYQGID